jgi:hypothetical protein
LLPEFFFKPSYDKLHRMVQLSQTALATRKQKGWHTKLLCSECEQFLNERYEKPMKAMWVDSEILPTNPRGGAVHVTGLEYSIFKLFHLSVLWRMTVSELAHMTNMRLGPHEEKIRHMLLEEKPGPPERYPILVYVVTLNGRLATDFVTPVIGRHVDNRHVYEIMFGGCEWHYIIASHSIPSQIQQYALKTDGSFWAPIKEAHEIYGVQAIWKAYQHNARVLGWPRLPTVK